MKPLLIVITGLPATGKTVLWKKLSEKLGLPFVSKDDFKEMMFDAIGWDDREWSKKIGVASWSMLYYVADQILKAGKGVIVEANFNPEFASERIASIAGSHDCRIFQIRCFSEGKTLFERFKKRANSGERHLGHRDSDSLSEWEPVLLKWTIAPLDVPGEFLDVDTTEIESVDYDEVFARVSKYATERG